MRKTIHKAVKTGYGLSLLTMRKAKKVASMMQKELGLNKEESVKLAHELMANSGKAAADVMKTVSTHFEDALVNSGVIKKRELKVAKKRVKVVKKRVKNVAKKAVKKAVKKATGKAVKNSSTKKTAKKATKKGKKR